MKLAKVSDCVKKAVEYMGAADWETKLIGFGCDGTNANMADGGLKGISCTMGNGILVLRTSPGIIVERCSKNHIFFASIDELLLQIYFMYENLPRNAVNWTQW